MDPPEIFFDNSSHFVPKIPYNDSSIYTLNLNTSKEMKLWKIKKQ